MRDLTMVGSIPSGKVLHWIRPSGTVSDVPDLIPQAV
jgi:hypothetical protein